MRDPLRISWRSKILISSRAIIYKEAEIQKRSFVATVNKYNAAAKESGSMQMDTNAIHDWSDVLSAQENFSQERESVTSRGVKGFVHRRLRNLEDNSKTFQSWLKLLPTESHYLSVLCGGLMLILGVSHLRHLDLQALTFFKGCRTNV